MSKPCNCKLCKETKMMRHIIGLLPKKEAAWLTDFYNVHIHKDMDLEYYYSIVSGDWPSAVEILTSALHTAKAKRKSL